MALIIDDDGFYFCLDTPDKVGMFNFTLHHGGDVIEAAFKRDEVEKIYNHLHVYFGRLENV